MACQVRLMCKEDIIQVTEIDREVFLDQWSPPNYQRELKNCSARYVVACDEMEKIEAPELKAIPPQGFRRLLSRLKQLLYPERTSGDELLPSSRQYIIGFAGFWIMADEAHITNIAVRKRHQRQGTGELLLISLIDLAVKLKVRVITLEVRVSNTAAQSLYYKYGFVRADLRQGYYLDNREDAVLMATGNINSDSFQANLQRLKQAHSRMWGMVLSWTSH